MTRHATLDDLRRYRSEIADRLRTARLEAGLSQQQVADALGLHRPTISEIEAGRRGVHLEELRALVDLYDTTFRWVMTGEHPEGAEQ